MSQQGAEETVTLPRKELQRLVHDLRNHLNALLMNAGVVSAGCTDKSRYARYIEGIEREGDKCAQLLSDVTNQHLQGDQPTLLR